MPLHVKTHRSQHGLVDRLPFLSLPRPRAPAETTRRRGLRGRNPGSQVFPTAARQCVSRGEVGVHLLLLQDLSWLLCSPRVPLWILHELLERPAGFRQRPRVPGGCRLTWGVQGISAASGLPIWGHWYLSTRLDGLHFLLMMFCNSLCTSVTKSIPGYFVLFAATPPGPRLHTDHCSCVLLAHCLFFRR